MSRALVRGVSPSYDRAIVRDPGTPIDVGLARAQHGVYRQHLVRAGHEVREIPTDPNHPDCVFIEDTAVVVGEIALITRPGAASRRGEVEPVAAALGGDLGLVRMQGPGTLDGGDVMQLGGIVYVGLSERTDPAGAAWLSDLADQAGMGTRLVPVSGVLHLKSAVLPISEDTVVVTPDAIDETLLSGLRIVHEEDVERHMFSALPLGNDEVLVTSAAPRTASAIAALGLEVIPIDVSEILAADGGLTCMSILY